MRDFDILHFDTCDNNANYNGVSAYDTTFKLSTTFRNIRKINLVSLEMPIVFTNIRNNTSNTLTLTVGGTVYNVVLATQSYTSMQSLINDVNAQLTGTNAPVFSILSGINVYITLKTTTTLSIANSILANTVMGFPQDLNITTPISGLKAQTVFSLNYDNFISLFLDIPSTCTSSGNRLISYKIPLNAVSGMVFYMANNNTFEQPIIISDQNFVLQQFRIQVFDRFGYQITRGVDYTFSLAIHYTQ